ncbi:MAG: SOS response-associated peptidase family protein [Sphingomonas sp.]
MCNEAARRVSVDQIHDAFREVRVPLLFPEGLPNLAALDSIRITDPTVIVRAAHNASAGAELIQRRWSWPGPGGKPVYNYRGDGRSFHNSPTGGRCLIPLDGFYEFTDPGTPAEDAHAQPVPGAKRQKKDKWLFTLAPGSIMGSEFFCVAGVWRADVKVGEAFSMLTCEPGPDIAPYHHRQIVLMPRAHWAEWLSGTVAATELIHPTPAGALSVTPAR